MNSIEYHKEMFKFLVASKEYPDIHEKVKEALLLSLQEEIALHKRNTFKVVENDKN